MGIATNYEAHENTVKSMSDQQIMQGMQNPNPSGPPPFMLLVEANIRKEMRDEQTRQEGLGQPTVLQQLTGTAPAPTPQTNVAGMPQGVASGMAQSMAPKTNVNQNTGIASVAPVATMASGGILKMQEGGDPSEQFILTNIPELGIREGQFVKVSAKTLEELNNAIPEVMARRGDKVKSVELMMNERDSALVALAREGDALIGTRVNRLLEQRAADSAAAPDLAPVSIPPATAEISSPTASTQDNLASINGVGIENVRRIRDSDAKRSEAAFLESLAPNNAQGQPGGILGAKYPEGRGAYSTSIVEALTNNDPYSGELSPSQTARNQKTLSDTLRREEVARQRADIAEAGEIAQDAADTRKAFSVPLESDAVETISTGEAKPNPFAVSKAPFNATSDGAQDPKPITIDSAVKPSEEVTNAQLEVFATDRVNPFAFNKAPETKKPEVFDPLKGLFMYQALADDAPTDDENYDAKTIIKRINELKTPEEKAATLTMLNNRFIDAEQKVESLEKRLQRARIAKRSGTGDYNYDVEAGVGRFGAGELTDTLKKELIAAKDDFNLLYKNIGGLVPASGFGGDFATERYFGKDTVNALNKLKADDLQAEAVADVVKVTANENYPVSPVEVRKRLRAMEEKDVDADERFDLAEARLDAERAEGLTAGENAYTASSPVRSSLDYTTLQKTGLGLVPSAPRNQLDNPDLSYKELISKQARDAKTGIKAYTGSAFPNTFDMDNRVATAEGVGLVDNLTDDQKEAHRLRKFETARKRQEEALLDRTDSAIKKASDMTSVLARAAGAEYIPEPSVVPERALTSGQVITAADNVGTAVLNTGKTAANFGAAALGGGDNYFDFDLEETTTIPPKSTTDFMVPNDAGDANTTLPFSYDGPPKTDTVIDKDAAEILKNLPLIDKTVKNGNVVTPAKDTGIAAINPMANRASDSPSSYEQKLLDILAEREKSADQDKWLGLAEMGMRLMASSNPNLLSAIGESGLGAFGSYMKGQKAQDAEELNILGKLADMDMAQQTLQARKDIARMAANAKSQKPLMTFGQINTQLQKDVDTAAETYEKFTNLNGELLPGVNKTEAMQAREDLQRAQTALVEHLAPAGIVPTLPYQNINNPIIDVR